MRYPPSENLEIIRRVEQSHLPVRRTGAARRLSRHLLRMVRPYQTGGREALEDRSPRPDRVWNWVWRL